MITGQAKKHVPGTDVPVVLEVSSEYRMVHLQVALLPLVTSHLDEGECEVRFWQEGRNDHRETFTLGKTEQMIPYSIGVTCLLEFALLIALLGHVGAQLERCEDDLDVHLRTQFVEPELVDVAERSSVIVEQ
jgi:hypothetical protein